MAQHHDGTATRDELERVFQAWDEALGARDADTAMTLYAPDATLESPLVCHLLGTPEGVVRGRENIRRFVADHVFPHQPPQRRRFRAGYLTDGRRLVWEYPRETPGDDQMDIVEVMEISGGLIQRHRVYWGWYGFGMLQRGEHSR